MERRDASRRTAAGALCAAALALALTGCGAGNKAETSVMDTAIGGVDVVDGTITLRDLQVDFGETGFYPEGGQAPLRVWIGNKAGEPVSLVSVESEAAETVTLATEVAQAPAAEEESPDEESPSPEESESPDEEAGESETPAGDEETPAGEDETSAEPALVGEPEFAVEVAPRDYVRLSPATGSFLLLEGLTRDLKTGTSLEVVFNFSDGRSVPVTIPVGVPGTPRERSYFEPQQEEH